jgi:hypothetical protein
VSVTAEAQRAEPRRRNRAPDFTERDAAALQWIGEQYGARLDVLGVLLGRLGGWSSPLTISGVRNQVERWKRQGLARAERALGETWVTPTRLGLDRVGLNLPTWKVPVTRVRHCHAVNIVRLYYEGTPAASESPWISERMTYRERGNGTWHIPDGVIRDPKHIDSPGPPRYIAVEIELTHKGRRVYQTEVFGNLRSGISAVSYFVPDQAFANRLSADIRAVLEGQGSTTRYSVGLLPEVPGVSYMNR